MNILGYFGLAGLRGHELVNQTALQDDGSGALSTVVILKLHKTHDTGVGGLEPSLGLEDTHIAEASGTVGLLCHSDTWHVDEVEADRGYHLSVVVTEDKTTVGFVVLIEVGRHDGEGLCCSRRIC